MAYTLKGIMNSLLGNLVTPDNKIIYVDSATGSNTNDGESWGSAMATLDAAIGKCTADNGDKILIAPGHTESYTTTGTKVTFDVDGVEIIGLGIGDSKPTFSFGHVSATMVMSANANKLSNVRFLTAVDSVVTFLTVSGNDNEVEVKSIDVTDKEVVRDIIVTGDRNKITVDKQGFITGDANVSVVALNSAVGGSIKVTGNTKVTTAVVNMITVLSSDIDIELDVLVNGTTNGSKLVVDTITGSTYRLHQSFDRGAESYFSGGSTGGIATDDVSAVSTKIGTPVNTGGTATIAGILGNPDNVTIVNRIAAVDGKADAIKAKTDLLPASPAATADIANALVERAPVNVRKTLTFATNDTGSKALFTVTGAVKIKLVAICTTGLTSDDVGTMILNAGTTALIASTTATDLIAGELWFDATPTTKVDSLANAELSYVIGDGSDITLDITNTVDSGVLVFNIQYEPLTSGATVVAV